jgi:hypothetical protein
MKQCRLTQFLQFLCRKGSGRSSPELCCGKKKQGRTGVNIPGPVGAFPLVDGGNYDTGNNILKSDIDLSRLKRPFLQLD